jgi:hypothetical protein
MKRQALIIGGLAAMLCCHGPGKAVEDRVQDAQVHAAQALEEKEEHIYQEKPGYVMEPKVHYAADK